MAKSIESLIYQSIANPNDPRRKELELMEKQKWMIDEKAKAQVRAELYFGLGFLTVYVCECAYVKRSNMSLF